MVTPTTITGTIDVDQKSGTVRIDFQLPDALLSGVSPDPAPAPPPPTPPPPVPAPGPVPGTAPAAELQPIGTDAVGDWGVVGEVHRVLVAGDMLYVGGEFEQIVHLGGEMKRRRNFATFDRRTGEPTNFAPDFDGDVRALALAPDGRTLYVGGAFKSVNGEPRSRVAALDIIDGELTGWSAGTINRPLRAIAVGESRVFIGGMFSLVGGHAVSHLAALDTGTGATFTGFDARLDDDVKALVLTGAGLWAGGTFGSAGGRRQRGLVLLDPFSGARLDSADASHDVIDLAADAAQLYVAIGGPGGRMAAVNLVSGEQVWEVETDGNAQAVAVAKGRHVYFGGHYEIVAGNKDADRLTRHDKRTGKMDVSWLPKVDGMRSINAIDVTADGLYVGGDFNRVGGEPHPKLAILPGTTG